jgi:beta-lactamase class A
MCRMTAKRIAAVAGVAGVCLLAVACATSTADAPTPADTESPRVEAVATTPTPTLRPGQTETLALDALSPAAAEMARGLRQSVGVAVYVPSQRRLYQYNAEPQFVLESVVKVPIMLTLLDRSIAQKKPLTADESYLLHRMIEESDNDATTALWIDLGGAPAVQAFLDSAGIDGATIDKEDWGDSEMSAEAGARLLGKLITGEILDAPNRALAMQLMSAVDPAQSWGAVVAATFEGEAGVKNGWYPEPSGWVLTSIGYAEPENGAPDYAIAIFTSGWYRYDEGVQAVEQIASLINTRLLFGE